jgi:excisionase family DNA binding protein
MSSDEILTAEEVSKFLKISVFTLYRWRRKGYGPAASRVGNRIRYRADDVRAWMATQKET